MKKVFLEILQNSQENTCARVSFLIKLQARPLCNFIKKETLAQVFSCEFCEISKSTFLIEHLWATAFLFNSFWLWRSTIIRNIFAWVTINTSKEIRLHFLTVHLIIDYRNVNELLVFMAYTRELLIVMA